LNQRAEELRGNYRASGRERLSLNASNCCFIKRKRNRFSDAERNRGANAAPQRIELCAGASRKISLRLRCRIAGQSWIPW